MTPRLRTLKTTVIGGLVFLLPLIVAIAVLGQALALAAKVAAPIAAHLPAGHVGGVAVGTLVAVALLLLLCYGAGLLARAAVGRMWSRSFEEKLHALYPRYTIIKGMAQGLYGEPGEHQLKSVLVDFDDRQQIAYEVERTQDGRVVVFLPGAPDPWSGCVVLVAPHRVAALAVDFGRLNQALSGIGRGTAALVD